MKPSLLICLFFGLTIASAQAPLGIFDNHVDVGTPKKTGSAQYDPGTQSYSVKGGGYNIWYNRDEFHFLYKKINGNFILTANFELVGNEDGNGHRKTGWMIRETTDADEVSVNACLHGDGLAVLQWRPIKGAFMRDPKDEIFFPKKDYQIIQLERIGRKITMRLAHDGEPLQEVGSMEMEVMKDQVLVGVYALAHDPEDIQEARIWNVRIDKPIPGDFDPNILIKLPPTQNKVLGSRLEIVDIANGKRKLIHESTTSRFGAPGWIPGDKKLLLNQEGSLYTIPIEGGAVEKFNTGRVTEINYGQTISPDGRQVAFSSRTKDGGSSLYSVPIQGGEPSLLSEVSSLHGQGWSIDGKHVFYVVKKGNTVGNIYKKTIGNAQEVPLTFNKKGHVGGPESSPDGKFIYYNDNTSGTMQLWRMKPDGSGKERLTFDQYHNWLPHVSPDGKWIAYLSFLTDIDPNGLPSYQNVTLKLMPTTVGAPRVIAYLYGGQGTINSPSWSRDSKYVAFVSNSEEMSEK